MAIKSHTDISQSRKLAEILPLESADMYWWSSGKRYYIEAMDDGDFNEKEGHVRAWSLSALLSIIRKTKVYALYGVINVYMSCDLGDEPWKLETELHDNEVDACYEMILKLNKSKLL